MKTCCCASSCCGSGTSNVKLGYSATQVKLQGAATSRGVCTLCFPAKSTFKIHSHVRADTHIHLYISNLSYANTFIGQGKKTLK